MDARGGTKQDYRRVASFAAPSKVNCVDVGRHSLQVLATGNTDRDVSLFSVRSPSPSMTLTGHTSPVESVRFDDSEEIVLAGSLGGVIKAWDLTVPKFMCSLRGHAGPVTCLDTFRSQYVASGSMDNCVKLWDLRSDGSCFTYAGHDKTVNSVNFCPNGSWLVSTSSDGTAKIWDLLAGKMLHEFVSPRFGMTMAVFHPHELLLATANNGGEVMFYDLEYFSELTLVRTGAPVSFLFFDDSMGHTLCALSAARLSVMTWEPGRLLSQIPLDSFSPPVVCPQTVAKFGSVTSPRLIVTDVIDNAIGAYSLPYDLLIPDQGVVSSATTKNGNSQSGMMVSTELGNVENNVVPRVIVPSASAVQSSLVSRSTRRASFAETERGHSVDIKLNSKEENIRSGQASMEELPEDSDAIFVPTKSLPRSPPSADNRKNAIRTQNADKFAPQAVVRPDPSLVSSAMHVNLPSSYALPGQSLTVQNGQAAGPQHYLVSPDVCKMGNPLAQSTPVLAANGGENGGGAATFRKTSSGQRLVVPGNSQHATGVEQQQQLSGGGGNAKSFNFPPRDTTSPRTRTIATVIPQRPQCTSSTQTSTPTKSTPEEPSPNSETSSEQFRHSGKPYDLSSFVGGGSNNVGFSTMESSNVHQPPTTAYPTNGLSPSALGYVVSVSSQDCCVGKNFASPKHGPLSEDDVLFSVKRDSVTVGNLLDQRGKLWSNCVLAWRREGVKGAFEYAQMSGNEGFEPEILGALAKRRKFWTLDLVSMALPRLRHFLTRNSNEDSMDGLVNVAIPCLRVILADFAPVLKSGLRNVSHIGVDVVQEERRAKCADCMRELAEIKHWLGSPSVKRKSNVFLDEICLLLRTID